MDLDELRKKIEEDEKSTKSSIEILRENLQKKDLKDFLENKDFYEDKLLEDYRKEIEEKNLGKEHKRMYKVNMAFKKMGILTTMIYTSHLLQKSIHSIQHKLNLCGKSKEQDTAIKLIIALFIGVIMGIPIVVIKKIIIFIVMK